MVFNSSLMAMVMSFVVALLPEIWITSSRKAVNVKHVGGDTNEFLNYSQKYRRFLPLETSKLNSIQKD